MCIQRPLMRPRMSLVGGESSEEGAGVDLERRSELQDVLQRDVALAALH